MTRRRTRAKPTPWRGGPVTPLERLAALAGRSTFVEPMGSRGTKEHGGAAELAAAIGGADCSTLEKRLALALAAQTPRDAATIQQLAYPLIRERLAENNHLAPLVDGPLAWRAAIVLRDAFLDLVAPDRSLPTFRSAARAARMRSQVYRRLHYEITAELEHLAATGARAAVKKLRR